MIRTEITTRDWITLNYFVKQTPYVDVYDERKFFPCVCCCTFGDTTPPTHRGSFKAMWPEQRDWINWSCGTRCSSSVLIPEKIPAEEDGEVAGSALLSGPGVPR